MANNKIINKVRLRVLTLGFFIYENIIKKDRKAVLNSGIKISAV